MLSLSILVRKMSSSLPAYATIEEARLKDAFNTEKVSICRLLQITVGILGVGFSFSVLLLLMSPSLEARGVPSFILSWAWLASPLSLILIQPVLAVWSDRARFSWGRRKPFLLVGYALVVGGCVMVGLAPEVKNAEALISITGFVFLMVSNNLFLLMIRAMVADSLPPSDLSSGYAFCTLFYQCGLLGGTQMVNVATHPRVIEFFSFLSSDTCPAAEQVDGQINCMGVRSTFLLLSILHLLLAHSVMSVAEKQFPSPPEKSRCILCFRWLSEMFQDAAEIFMDSASGGALRLVSLASALGWIGVATCQVFASLYASQLSVGEEGILGISAVSMVFYASNVLGILLAMFLPCLEAKAGAATLLSASLFLFGGCLVSAVVLPSLSSIPFVRLSWVLGFAPMYSIMLTLPLTLASRAGLGFHSQALQIALMAINQAGGEVTVTLLGSPVSQLLPLGGAGGLFVLAGVCSAVGGALAWVVARNPELDFGVRGGEKKKEQELQPKGKVRPQVFGKRQIVKEKLPKETPPPTTAGGSLMEPDLEEVEKVRQVENLLADLEESESESEMEDFVAVGRGRGRGRRE